MRRIVMKCLLFLSIVSCDRPMVNGLSREEISGGGSFVPPPVGIVEWSSIYVSAVNYADGYDWEKDEYFGNVAFDILLYEDGKQILRIPSDGALAISPDPQRHRIIDGHIYTDAVKDGKTFVACDGKLLWETTGNEVFVSMMKDDDGRLLTLSRINGKGFKYSIDGKEMLSRLDADIVTPLHSDGGNCYFSYTVGEKCFLVENGEPSQVQLPEDMMYVYDLRSIGGKVYAAVNMENRPNNPYVSIAGGEFMPIGSDNRRSSMYGCYFLTFDNEVLLTGYMTSAYYPRWDYVWDLEGNVIKTFDATVSMRAMFKGPEGYAYVLENADGSGCRVIAPQGEWAAGEEGIAKLISTSCIAASENGKIYLGLSGSAGVCLYVDGIPERYPVNGFITGISPPKILSSTY